MANEKRGTLHEKPKNVVAIRERKEEREKQKQLRYKEVYAGLPDSCSYTEEMEWIRAHPKMGEFRGAEGEKQIRINALDILEAPSKSAANSLKHWVNRPDEFFKQVLSEQKKNAGVESSGETTLALEGDINEIIGIIKTLKAPPIH